MSANSQHKSNEKTQSFIDGHEEQTGEYDHQQDHARRDQRLAPRRPYDLRGLGAHLLDKFERVGHISFPSKIVSRSRRRKGRNPDAPGQKNSRRGTSRSRATGTSYRIAGQLAKKNVTMPATAQNFAAITRRLRRRAAR